MKKKLISYLAIGCMLIAAVVLARDTESIHAAAYRGDIEQVQLLLQAKPDPDARDSFGGTALHAAMFQDNLKIVRLLVEAGFDVNAVGPANGYTPLHDAVWANNLPALKYLVEQGGDLSIKSLEGQTPLEKAESENKSDIVRFLKSQMN